MTSIYDTALKATTEELIAKAVTARVEMEKAQEALGEAIKDTIERGFATIFDRYPILGSVVWTQYTPYWNDGEPCVFHSSFTYPSLNSVKDVEDETDSTYGDEAGEDWYLHSEEQRHVGWDADRRSLYEPNPDYDERYSRCEEEIKTFVKSLAGDQRRTDTTPTMLDSILYQAFGDHARVTITREGIEVDGCEHD